MAQSVSKGKVRPRDDQHVRAARPVEYTLPFNKLVEVLSLETITLDHADATAHRTRLKRLADRIRPGEEFERELQVALHAYRETTEKKAMLLRVDLASAVDVIEEYAAQYGGGDQAPEKKLTNDLQRLAALGQLRTLGQLHAGLDSVGASLRNTIEEIRQRNQATVAQLRDEIRTLKRTLEATTRRQDQPGTLANRAPFERQIRVKVANHDIFSLYLIRVSNWKELFVSFDQEELQTLAADIATRLTAVIGRDAFSGRWYDGYFAAIVPMDKATAMAWASELARELSGVYATGHLTAAIRARIAVVEHVPGQGPEQVLHRIEQLILAFGG